MCLMLGSWQWWERSGSPQSRDPNICSVSCLSLDCAYQNNLSCSNPQRHQCQLSWAKKTILSVSVCHVLLIVRQKWVILKCAYALYTDSLFLPADRSLVFFRTVRTLRLLTAKRIHIPYASHSFEMIYICFLFCFDLVFFWFDNYLFGLLDFVYLLVWCDLLFLFWFGFCLFIYLFYPFSLGCCFRIGLVWCYCSFVWFVVVFCFCITS